MVSQAWVQGPEYVGPARVRLYVDETWVDDACAIQYQARDDKTPKFGYNDERFRTVALGHTLVQGQLSINFRMNGYLRFVVDEHLKRRADRSNLSDWKRAKPRRGGLKDLDLTGMHADDILSTAMGIAERGELDLYKDFSEAMKMVMWARVSDKDGPPVDARASRSKSGSKQEQQNIRSMYRYHRPGLFSTGFDIKILVGQDPVEEYKSALTKVIRDVHLVGEAFVANIDVPDGSRAVREVYNFFARDVVPGPSSDYYNRTVGPWLSSENRP